MNIWNKFHNKINFYYQDQPFIIKECLDNPSQYASWKTVEDCLNNPQNFSIEAINKFDGSKIEIPTTKCYWIPYKEVQVKSELFNILNDGHTMIIAEYSWYNELTNSLVQDLENSYDIGCDIHVYCSTQPSRSFHIHDDIPANLICQVEGKTRWKVYDNRSSVLYQTGRLQERYRNLPEENFNVILDEVLEPGDVLYIPARQFHAAIPSEPRISMSIPCFSTQLRQFDKYDRNQYRSYKGN
jgi:ribosomal protein L16 Arg81 hydroxylase